MGAPPTTAALSPRKAPPEPVSAADCPRRFILLEDGGVRVRWACGAEFEDRNEVGVDVVVLKENIGQDHHHLVARVTHRR